VVNGCLGREAAVEAAGAGRPDLLFVMKDGITLSPFASTRPLDIDIGKGFSSSSSEDSSEQEFGIDSRGGGESSSNNCVSVVF
jgi:hypothetical protein